MTTAKTILIIDDEKDIRNLVAGILEDEGYETLQAANSQEAYSRIQKDSPDLLILDIWLEGSADDGMDILESVKKTVPLLPVIMISGHGTIETAVTALKKGAYDFIEKPFKADRLLIMARRALETASLQKENKKLRSYNTPAHLQLIGKSEAYKNFESILRRVAKTNSRVVLQGEAGTGKTAAARFIHDHSPRAEKPFIIINCATLNPDRFEIELFGAEKGIDGHYATEGLLQESDGGTLLFDEVADMPPTTQAKMIKVLQENRFQRVGGHDFIEVDIRFIVTTHKNLPQEVAEGRFREDLFYRLNVVPISTPPLRDCREDIDGFVSTFSAQISPQIGGRQLSFSPDALSALRHYAWPGNMRQLRNVIEWIAIMHANKEVITRDDLPAELSAVTVQNNKPSQNTDSHTTAGHLTEYNLKDARAIFESEYIHAQMERFDGNISKTADFIGMERSALHRKIKQLQLSHSEGNLVALKTVKS